MLKAATSEPRPTPATRSAGMRLSWRGRLVVTVLLLPGVAAALFSLYLPNSDQGGVFSVAALTFYVGALVVLTAPAWAVMHAFWVPSLRAADDEAAWRERRPLHRPPRVVVTVLGLVVANGLAMFWFGRLAGHADVEQVTMGLFGLATVAHVALLTRHRW
jgi:hypothetical protein